jgi:hypothetical protein
MSGAIRDKIIFVFLFLTLGVSVRWIVNHWKPSHKPQNNQSLSSATRKTSSPNGANAIRFSDICWRLEQEASQNQKLSLEQSRFIQAASTGFCFCMRDQIDKHQYLGTAASSTEMQHNYFDFLRTTQGLKTKEYCHQVAKFELYRKTGRAVAALKPPTKPMKQSKPNPVKKVEISAKRPQSQ